MKRLSVIFFALLSALATAAAVHAQTDPRARQLGVPFEGTPGPLDAITDVKGVEVGYRTLISGDGKLVVGKGPVRTGVTAIFPRGKQSLDPFSPGRREWRNRRNDLGAEIRFMSGPVMITNTHSVGVVRDAVIAWQLKYGTALPLEGLVVAAGGRRNLGQLFERHQRLSRHSRGRRRSNARCPRRCDRRGQRRRRHRNDLLEFKGGTGTASRKLPDKLAGYTVGVLVQCNFGTRHLLRIAGVPVGCEITGKKIWGDDTGSIIVVVATDAPLLPSQLQRIAKRVTLGLGRLGSISGDGSGDIFIAFSTANRGAGWAENR